MVSGMSHAYTHHASNVHTPSISTFTFHVSISQIKKIIGEFGLVVISRHGFDAEKFVYESDKLFSFKVSTMLLVSLLTTHHTHHIQSNIHFCTEWIWNDVSSTKIRYHSHCAMVSMDCAVCIIGEV